MAVTQPDGARQPRQAAQTSSFLGYEDDAPRCGKASRAIADHLGLDVLREKPLRCYLDEPHKNRRWKALLKDLFDSWGNRGHFVVTRSSRLDVDRRPGGSLMGRNPLYRMHPLRRYWLDVDASDSRP